MTRPRSILLGLHRYVGLALTAFLLLAGPTGSIAAFHDALDGWLNPDLFHARSHGALLSPSALSRRLAEQVPNGRLGYLIYRPAPGETVRAYLQPAPNAPPRKRDEIFLDPATGDIRGVRATDGCCFSRRAVIPFLYRFHYTLGLGRTGIVVMGVVALVWAFDCVVGLLLTLPVRCAPWRRESWRRWGLAWRIEPNKRGFRRLFDLHRAVSLWFWIVLLGVAISGVSLNLGDEIFQPVVSALLPVTPPAPIGLAANGSDDRTIGLDAADRIATEAASRAGWQGRPGALFILGDGKIAFYFADVDGKRARGLGGAEIVLDRRTGGVAKVAIPGRGKIGDAVLDLQFPWHSGQLVGLPGRILIAVSGIVVPILAVTGLMIWHRKRRPRRRATTGRAARAEQLRPS